MDSKQRIERQQELRVHDVTAIYAVRGQRAMADFLQVPSEYLAALHPDCLRHYALVPVGVPSERSFDRSLSCLREIAGQPTQETWKENVIQCDFIFAILNRLEAQGFNQIAKLEGYDSVHFFPSGCCSPIPLPVDETKQAQPFFFGFGLSDYLQRINGAFGIGSDVFGSPFGDFLVVRRPESFQETLDVRTLCESGDSVFFGLEFDWEGVVVACHSKLLPLLEAGAREAILAVEQENGEADVSASP